MLRKVWVIGLALVGFTVNTAANEGTTLNFCSEGSPEGFDPAMYTTSTTFDASSRQIYNRLVEFERGTTNVVPALAESYEVSDDGLEYTFKLRPGVKFHYTDYFSPSRDLNADDVVFSFERQLLADNPYNLEIGGTWEYFNGMSMPELMESIKAVDDLTVKITLRKPDATMIAKLAMDFASIVSKEYADALLKEGAAKRLIHRPIGTGPFKYRDYETDIVIRFFSHDDYWAGRSAIDVLKFMITPDSSVGYEKLKSGECHVLGYPNPSDIVDMQQDPELRVLVQEGMNIGYLAHNTQLEPFNNINVRRAINMAIDKQAILDQVFRGTGTPAKNPFPPTVWAYDETTVDDPFDPVTAKAMLADEGIQNLKMQLWVMPVVRAFNPDSLSMAEIIKDNLAEIGVDVEIISYEWGEFLSLSKDLDRVGAVLFGWTGDNGDPDNFLGVLLGCDAVGNANRAQWCYEPFDKLIQKAKVESDKAERTRLYRQAQVLFKQQAPWATIAHSLVYKAVRKEVQNFRMDPFGGHIFYGVSLAQ